MNKRVIIAGGGTGGHIFPAIAIANALKKKDNSIQILFVGAKGKMEMEKVPQAGYPIEGIDIAGFNRSSLIKNVGLPFKLIKSFFQVRRIIHAFKPGAVIGVGGYSSFPVLRYAQARHIPTFLHESNSFAGKSNQMLGKNADKIFVAADKMEKFFPADKIVITGNPVRQDIASHFADSAQARAFFNLDPSKKTVLVTGGSLGAKGINEAIAARVEEFEKADIQLIWQTGRTFIGKAKELSVNRKNIWANDFIMQMEYAYAAADVVISRAGAMAIAELSVAGKPVVFVPFPYAAEDHQTANAKSLEEKGAGIMIRDKDANEQLVSAAIDLINDDKKKEMLALNISKLGVRDADDRIASFVLESLKKNENE